MMHCLGRLEQFDFFYRSSIQLHKNGWLLSLQYVPEEWWTEILLRSSFGGHKMDSIPSKQIGVHLHYSRQPKPNQFSLIHCLLYKSQCKHIRLKYVTRKKIEVLNEKSPNQLIGAFLNMNLFISYEGQISSPFNCFRIEGFFSTSDNVEISSIGFVSSIPEVI